MCSEVIDEETGQPTGDCILCGTCGANPPDDDGNGCPNCQVNVPFASPKPWGDFNDDTYPDLVLGNPQRDDGAGAIDVYHGTSGGLPGFGSPSQTWDRDSSGILGAASSMHSFGLAHAIGDFDDDGYDDLAIGVPVDAVSGVDGAGSVHVMYGSASGLSASGDQIFHQNTPGIDGVAEAGDNFGTALAAGDFNCDGYDDIAVGVPDEAIGSDAAAGAINIIYGSSGGLTATGDQVFYQDFTGVPGASEPNDRFGSELVAGNFDGNTSGGNACDDLAVAIPFEDSGSLTDSGMVAVFDGDSSGLSGANSVLLDQDFSGIEGTAEAGDAFGFRLRAIDLDSDGYDDLALHVPGDESRAVIYGSSSGLSGTSDVLVSSPKSVMAGFPHIPCSETIDGTTKCTCTPEWDPVGGCGFVEPLCEAYDMDFTTSSGLRWDCES